MCDSLESYVTWFDQDNTLERDVNGCDQNHSLKSDLGHRLLVVVMSRLISESSISWFDQDNTLERDVNGCDQNHSLKSDLGHRLFNNFFELVDRQKTNK